MRKPIRRNFHLGSGDEGRRRLEALEELADRLGIDGQHGPGLSKMLQMIADGKLRIGKTDVAQAEQAIEQRIEKLRKELEPVEAERERLMESPLSEMDTGDVQGNALLLAKKHSEINGLHFAQRALAKATRLNFETWLHEEA